MDARIIRKLNLNDKVLRNISLDEFYKLPIGYLLCNTSNEGIYIYSLIFYLINLQNEFVQFYLSSIKSKGNMVEIELENLSKNDCISFSIEKDLQRIIYMHSNYSLENSQNVNLEFDFVKIQESIEKRFLIDKPVIKTEVSLFRNFGI